MAIIIPTQWNLITMHEDIKTDTILYHIFPKGTFEAVISNRTLRFKKIGNWTDTWEIPSKYITNIEKVEDAYVKTVLSDYKSLLSEQCVGMCFTEEFDKEAMWHYYTAGGSGVCIETTVENLLEALNLDQIEGAFIGPVVYLDVENELSTSFLNNIVKTKYPVYKYMGYLKRNIYNYEKEIRIVADISEKVNEAYIDIRIDLNKLIKKIYMSPQIKKSGDKENEEDERLWIKDVCERANLQVPIENSKLYIEPSLEFSKYTKEEISDMIQFDRYEENNEEILYTKENGRWTKA